MFCGRYDDCKPDEHGFYFIEGSENFQNILKYLEALSQSKSVEQSPSTGRFVIQRIVNAHKDESTSGSIIKNLCEDALLYDLKELAGDLWCSLTPQQRKGLVESINNNTQHHSLYCSLPEIQKQEMWELLSLHQQRELLKLLSTEDCVLLSSQTRITSCFREVARDIRKIGRQARPPRSQLHGILNRVTSASIDTLSSAKIAAAKDVLQALYDIKSNRTLRHDIIQWCRSIQKTWKDNQKLFEVWS